MLKKEKNKEILINRSRENVSIVFKYMNVRSSRAESERACAPPVKGVHPILRLFGKSLKLSSHVPDIIIYMISSEKGA